jgi:hypothetical protein
MELVQVLASIVQGETEPGTTLESEGVRFDFQAGGILELTAGQESRRLQLLSCASPLQEIGN